MAKAPGSAGSIKSTWDRIREIPSFVAAIIALVSVLITAATFIVGYFATRAQLRTVDCVYENFTNSLSAQIEQIVHLGLYDRYRAQLIEQQKLLDATPADHALQLKVDELKRDMNEELEKTKAAQLQSQQALNAKEECLRKGSPP